MLAKIIGTGLAFAMATGAGCVRPPPAEQAREGDDGGSRPAGKPTILLIDHPRDLREDFVYPPAPAVQQAFYWQSNKAEWRFQLQTRGYAYTGFRFLKSHNLQVHRDHYVLQFTISPALMARYFWIGLVDGDDDTPKRLVELPLAGYLPSGRARKATTITIPLRDFPNLGTALYHEEMSQETVELAPFDWSDVREIRFIHSGGRLPNREVSITDLKFQR